MPLDWSPTVAGATGAIIGTGLDIATADWRYRKQLEQQEKLSLLQEKIQNRLTDYNAKSQYDLAMKMWENTNAAAQVEQYKKAGLNVGLMYKAGGAGGTTIGSQAGSIGGGSAQMPEMNNSAAFGQIGLQASQAMANVELTKAQTENVEADTENKKGAVKEKLNAEIRNLNANSTTREIENAYLTQPTSYSYMNAKGELVTTQLSGLDQRRLNESYARESVKVKTQLDRINSEQLPIQLQNEIQKVAIEAGKLNVMYQNAETEAKKVELQAAMNSIIKTYNEESMKLKNEQFAQDKTEFWVNKGQENINNVISVMVPWYTPTSTTTTTESVQEGEGWKERQTQTTTKKKK